MKSRVPATSTIVAILVAFATAAFGSVYEWGYIPILAFAGLVGIWPLAQKPSAVRQMRAMTIGLSVVGCAIALQLLPLSREAIGRISPQTVSFLSEYSLQFATGNTRHALSINPPATAASLLGFVVLATYFLGLASMLTRAERSALAGKLLLVAVPVALVGILGKTYDNGLMYGFWMPEAGTTANAFGPFVNRNHFAGWMLMMISVGMGFFCAETERSLRSVGSGLRKRLLWFSSTGANRLILTGTGVVVMAMALVWTLSRSGILSLVCAVIAFVLLPSHHHAEGIRRRVFIVFVLTSTVLISLQWRGLELLHYWFRDTTDVKSRLAAWRDAWRVIVNFPLTGTGIGTYPVAMLLYQQNNPGLHFARAHNDYLQLAAEGGLLVLLPSLWLIAVGSGVLIRTLRKTDVDPTDYWIRAGASIGMLAAGIQECVEFSLRIPANSLLFATLAALALSPSQASARRDVAQQT
jgi:O-antigen ligase